MVLISSSFCNLRFVCLDVSLLNVCTAKIGSNFLPNIKAIHINHNLSKNSAAWAEHCKDFCSKCNIDLIIESVHINSDGGGIESAARRARFEIFKNILEENNQILVKKGGKYDEKRR